MDAFILHQKDLAFLHICYWSLIGENLLNTYYINNCLYRRSSCTDFSIWTSPYFSVFFFMNVLYLYIGPFISNQKDLAFLHMCYWSLKRFSHFMSIIPQIANINVNCNQVQDDQATLRVNLPFWKDQVTLWVSLP